VILLEILNYLHIYFVEEFLKFFIWIVNMNKDLHKIIFSRIRNAFVVVSETASSVTGSVRGSCVRSHCSMNPARFVTGGLSLSFLLMASAWASTTVPQGGVVAQGQVAVSQSGNVLTVNQSSDKAIVNWQSFSIGASAAVNIVQPSASSTHLSRVTGNDPSIIQGQLNSNGQVVLINPNGIVVGKDGSVSASSFTASTLNITDADFMAGKYQYARNGTHGEVVNQGKIQTAAGGYVALIGAKVTNEGTILSQQGAVYLGAGDAVAVPVTGSGRIKFEVSPAAINTSVSNNKDAVIMAEDGQVYMRAASLNDLAVASVQQSGLVDVSGEQGGNVTVLADKGHIKVDGTVKANSTVAANKGGNIVIGHDLETGVLAAQGDYSGAKIEAQGGFVETSGEWIATTGTRVLASEWLLDPYNIVIVNSGSTTPGATAIPDYTPGADSVILATNIADNLNAGTSVTISTGLAGSAGSSDGNITVSSAIVKSGANNAKLTLSANNSITVGARIGKAAGGATSTGKLDIEMTAYGNAVNTVNSRGIILNNVLDANGGVVKLTGASFNSSNSNFGFPNVANGGIVFNTSSGINAASYEIHGTATIPSNRYNVNGVSFAGAGVVLNSTGNSKLFGSSNSNGNFGPGVYFAANANTTINSGAGTVIVAGQHQAGFSGIRIGQAGEPPASRHRITTTGNVTISSENTSGVLGGRLSFRTGLINVNGGTLNLKGDSIDFFDGTAELQALNGTTVNLYARENIMLSSAWSGGLFRVNNDSNSITINITSKEGTIESSREMRAGKGTINLSAPNIRLKDKALNDASSVARVTTAQTVNIETNNLIVNSLHLINTAVSGLVSHAPSNAMTIKTLDPSSGIRIQAADTAGWLGLSQAELNNFTTAHLILGHATNTGGIQVVGNTVTSDNIGALSLRTAGNIAINESLKVGNTTLRNLSLEASGTNSTVTQGGSAASGVIRAAGLSLLGSDATYTLTNQNNVFSTLAGIVKSADIFDDAALTVGTIGAGSGLVATGTIKIASNSNISITQKIETTDASSSAIYLNAGHSTDAGTETGGDVKISGSGQLLAPSSATIQILTGSIAGSTGLGIAVGNNRYGSDETTTSYNTTTQAIGVGKYAIYREKPTITAQFKNINKSYDGTLYSGNGGYDITGLINNDVTVLSNFDYTGTSQGAKNVGTYSIGASSVKSDLGYSISFSLINGSLSITPKSITASLAANNKTYDGNANATGTISLGGLVTGEALSTSFSSMTFDNKNAGTGKVVTASGIALADSGEFSASNYVLGTNTATGFAGINKKLISLDLSAASILDKSYDATTSAVFNVAPTLVGVLTGETVGVSVTTNFIDPNAGNNKLTTLSNIALLGGDAINYELVSPGPTTLTGNITKARVSVLINNVSASVGVNVPFTFTVNGLVGGQTETSAGITLVNLRADGYSTTSLNSPGTYKILADALNAQNYELSGLNAILPGVLTVIGSSTSTILTETTDTTRSSPEFTGSTSIPTSSNSSRAAVVISGAEQGGEFSLASALDCATESCRCEVSEFDRDVELCYEEDVNASRIPVRRNQITL
jgi:filamentous hemagglutinin family protein